MPTRKISQIIRNQRILTAPASVTVRQACRQMVNHRVGAVMVVDQDGRLTGIFTERDALARVLAVGLDPDTTLLEAVMTAQPTTISPERPLGHALHLMYDGGFRHVPVVENGRPVGMVSARDALGPELAAFENELEQRELITALL
jgi:CBS domain-containing protein